MISRAFTVTFQLVVKSPQNTDLGPRLIQGVERVLDTGGCLEIDAELPEGCEVEDALNIQVTEEGRR